MAEVSFEAFVEDVISSQSGAFGLKTAEPHSRKDDAGKWQTVARTFRTVKASRDAGVSFDGFAKGDRVRVVGSEKTEVREWQGKKFYDLVVWAESVVPVPGRAHSGGESAAPVADTWGAGENYGDNTPF